MTMKQPEAANAHFVTDQLAVGGDFDTFDEARAFVRSANWSSSG